MSASKRSFQGGETMSMLSFRVILVSLVFSIVVAFGLGLIEFSKAFIKFLLKNDNVFKGLFQNPIVL
jgi:hypothetical protein